MVDLPEDIRELVLLFATHGVEFAICGGHAVAFHGYPRLTMDVDLLIAPSEKNAERVMAALEEFGFGDAGIPRDVFTKEGAAVTLGAQPSQVDLLTSISGVATDEVMQRVVWGELAGLKVRYISRDDLMEAKRQAGRGKDLADLEELEKLSRGE
jgi:predicted nucleotidyltransferase